MLTAYLNIKLIAFLDCMQIVDYRFYFMKEERWVSMSVCVVIILVCELPCRIGKFCQVSAFIDGLWWWF